MAKQKTDTITIISSFIFIGAIVFTTVMELITLGEGIIALILTAIYSKTNQQ